MHHATPSAAAAGVQRCWRAVLLISLASCVFTARAARVVQVVIENSSPFVTVDPNDPQYVISLRADGDTDDVAALEQHAAARHVLMTDADGRRFNCTVPAGGASTLQSPSKQRTDISLRSPFELLEPLSALCLYRQDGLWTYEVCHRRLVRQFRQEAGKKAEEFSCGRYTGDDQQTEAILEDGSSSGHTFKYVSHTYVGGAKCVLTGQPRSAEVRYTCARGVKENTLLSVREFPTCNYIFVVATPFLCKHPALEAPPEDVRHMSCVPTGPPVAAAEVSERRLTGGGAAAGAAASAAASSSSSVAGGDGDVAQLHDAPHVSGSGGSSSSSSAATDQDDGMLDATLHGAPQADDGSGSGSSSSGSSSMLPDHSDPWGGDGDGLGPLDGAGYYEGLGYYEDDDDDDGYYGDYDDEEDDDDGTGLPPIPRRRGRSSAPEAEYYDFLLSTKPRRGNAAAAAAAAAAAGGGGGGDAAGRHQQNAPQEHDEL